MAGDAASFAIAFEATGPELEASVDGRIDGVDALLAMFSALMDEVRRCGARQVLVIDHTHGAVPPEDGLRRLALALDATGFGGIRLAWVDARGTALSRMELAEIVGREHGYDVRVFDNASRARIWLHYGGE